MPIVGMPLFFIVWSAGQLLQLCLPVSLVLLLLSSMWPCAGQNTSHIAFYLPFVVVLFAVVFGLYV